MSAAPLLTARGITKAFPGVVALQSVDFSLNAGEIHALMGENGAGKSTLIKIVTGVYEADAGTIELDGSLIRPRSPLEAQALGISTVYQEVNLIPELSVAENLFLGRQPMALGRISWRTMRERARASLTRLDVHIDVTRRLSSYSIAIQQMVAVARALDVDAKALVLDEPTSSLDAGEVAQLFAVMRKLRSEGLGIVFVSHFLGQIYEISDRITVLRNGRLVGTYETSQLPQLELVSKMLGKEVGESASSAPRFRNRKAEAVAVRAEGIVNNGGVGPIDFSIEEGEVVGLAGLLGSGRTEVARMLFGLDKLQRGSIAVADKPAKIGSPRDALALGFGLCPEDRKSQGIVPHLSVRENISLALQARRGWLRAISKERRQAIADEFIRALAIAIPDADKPVGELSGGNQQKVILARWLAADLRFLILDEPTRGIDVGAKAEIERLMADLCAKGMAILFISSELEEVVRDSDRVVVLRDRRKVGELSGEEIGEENVMQLIAEGSG